MGSLYMGFVGVLGKFGLIVSRFDSFLGYLYL